ncbi:hypothetical protein [Pseudonocardia charpentierae]|uniref:Dolichyl-phosphate-mannose-protein mannosyltransferase n=1 Tax=Pseudonocardia charpentierae TaxID=3075545 RepID=A0ABU2N5T7_9PSEU|nr:hypothetical protein [Pseudonocardia sp. DSM 45834]MDT0349293.1 hypothetical protein [Pseudonocardia sp. DSM 45834]
MPGSSAVITEAPDVEVTATGRRRRWATPALLVGCVVLAAVSLRLPAIVGYDPWVWLIWGRELTGGTLSSDGTIAWKPLPVLVTALLAPFGEAAPQLWLLVSRAVGLSGLVAVGSVAARLARGGARAPLVGAVAATVAVVAFLLTPDGEARWLRHLLQGNIEPVTAALCVWAVRRHLDGRPGQAMVLGALAGLTRPETWPFLLMYAAWLQWRAPRRWWVLVPALSAVPVLWFGGDRLASGNALAGAATAQVLLETPEERLVLAVDSALAMVPAAVWAAAAVAVVWGAHRRRVAPALLAGAALAWAVLVVVMAAQLGYAAIGRFYAPAAALLCVLAGVAVGWLAGSVWVSVVRSDRTRRWLDSTERTRLSLGSAARGALPVVATAAVLAVVALAAAPSVTPRLEWLPAQLAAAAVRADAEADLVAFVVAAGGRDGLLACGPLSVDATWPAGEVRPRLAWMLDLPMAGVRNSLDNGPGITVMRSGTLLDHTLALRPPDLARPLLRSRDWVAYAEYCPVGLPRG